MGSGPSTSWEGLMRTSRSERVAGGFAVLTVLAFMLASAPGAVFATASTSSTPDGLCGATNAKLSVLTPPASLQRGIDKTGLPPTDEKETVAFLTKSSTALNKLSSDLKRLHASSADTPAVSKIAK